MSLTRLPYTVAQWEEGALRVNRRIALSKLLAEQEAARDLFIQDCEARLTLMTSEMDATEAEMREIVESFGGSSPEPTAQPAALADDATRAWQTILPPGTSRSVREVAAATGLDEVQAKKALTDAAKAGLVGCNAAGNWCSKGHGTPVLLAVESTIQSLQAPTTVRGSYVATRSAEVLAALSEVATAGAPVSVRELNDRMGRPDTERARDGVRTRLMELTAAGHVARDTRVVNNRPYVSWYKKEPSASLPSMTN